MVYEIYGPPDSGKTTYTLDLIKPSEHLSLYVNADFQIMRNIVDANLYILNSNDITTIKEAVITLKDSIDTIIIDSLPMINNNEHNIDKVISDIQKIISICKRNNIDLYIINQYRMNKQHEEYTYYLNRLRLYYNKRIKVGKYLTFFDFKNIYKK